MNLVLDIGNTRTKAALFSSTNPMASNSTTELTEAWLDEFIQADCPDAGIISATGLIPDWLPGWMDRSMTWFELTHHTQLPFQNHYRTPATLGRDRTAGIAGALALGYSPPLLVIDAGTCITIDLLEAGHHYHGGSISPGLRMRLEAMHTFTARLPLAEWQASPTLPGLDTAGSLTAGAQWGGVCEIEGMIHRYRAEHPNLNVIVTGGDMDFLAKHMNSVIFAHSELVLIGLNQILNHELEA
ncbi:MAG: type III pantothenate kinase [Saprospiraceae bacterium]|nr:type III pantothenate kinase [Saprospiraceae bacterium]